MLVKKRFITLIEMMVVIFLIGLITAVIAYNYQGSLEKGKAFKTEIAIDKIETILNLHIAEEPELLDDISTRWKQVIRSDPLVKDPEQLIKDGWGYEYEVTVDDNAIKVRSERLENYKRGR